MTPVVVWEGRVCEEEFSTKKLVTSHVKKHHAASAAPVKDVLPFSCEFCEETLPTKRALGQHERGKHQALVSGQRYLKTCSAILSSGLTDWQKRDALIRFARPQLDFML